MDWPFLLIVGGVLFVVIVGALCMRYWFEGRVDEIERKENIKQEAKETAESNSGL
jgi:hypothetical protein